VSVPLYLPVPSRRPRLLFPSPSTSPTEAVRLRSPPRLRSPSISPTEIAISIYLSDRGGKIAISAEIAISIYLSDRGGATRARVLPQLPAVLARVVLEVAKLDAYEKRNTARKRVTWWVLEVAKLDAYEKRNTARKRVTWWVLEVAKLDAYEKRNTGCEKEMHGGGSSRPQSLTPAPHRIVPA